MTISDNLIQNAILQISQIEGIEINPDELVDDIVLLAFAFPKDDDFILATAQVANHLNLLVQNRIKGTDLRQNYDGWKSCHFQSAKKNGHEADLRIVYQDIPPLKRIRGFGHRKIPESVYKRLMDR